MSGNIITALRDRIDRLPSTKIDRSVMNDLNWARRGCELPSGLELQWYGVAGFRLAYEGTSVLIDPFLNRAPLSTLLTRKRVRAEPGLIPTLIDGADAILMGHTHWDHVFDAPEIVRRFGCPAYGSTSLERLLDLYGLGDKAVVVDPEAVYEVGPFTIRFVPSIHSPLLLGKKVPFDGEITCDSVDSLTLDAYRCSQMWGIFVEVAGVSFYHDGLAMAPDQVLPGPPDYFLATIAGRSFAHNTVADALSVVQPSAVVPAHYDNFFAPLESAFKFSVGVNLSGFIDEVRDFSDDLPILTLDPLQTLSNDT